MGTGWSLRISPWTGIRILTRFRGNQLFLDLCDHPDEVKRLVDMCAEAIIVCDKRFREEL